MIFDITGSLLEQLVEVANRIKTTVADAAKQAFILGIKQLELDKIQIDAIQETTPSPSIGDSSLIMKTTEEFIRENYGVGIHKLPSTLTHEQKQKVKEKLPTMTLREIATELNTSVCEMFRARNEIIRPFISENWKTLSDSEMAKALGFKYGVQVAQVRFELGLRRDDLRKKAFAINPEELKKAITEDGETLQGFIRRKGLPITCEYLRQIAGNFGINTKQRTALWYANKYGHPELDDKATVERLLAEKGRAPSAAAAVGLTVGKFLRICKAHGITPPKNRPPAGMIELTCSQCGSKFKRPKALFESQRSRRPEQTLWFCSKKCQGKKLGSLKGDGKMVELICAVCGKTFKRYASLVKAGQKHFFCNKECRYKLLPRGCNRGKGRKSKI